jgi:hypothetical protein
MPQWNSSVQLIYANKNILKKYKKQTNKQKKLLGTRLSMQELSVLAVFRHLFSASSLHPCQHQLPSFPLGTFSPFFALFRLELCLWRSRFSSLPCGSSLWLILHLDFISCSLPLSLSLGQSGYVEEHRRWMQGCSRTKVLVGLGGTTFSGLPHLFFNVGSSLVFSIIITIVVSIWHLKSCCDIQPGGWYHNSGICIVFTGSWNTRDDICAQLLVDKGQGLHWRWWKATSSEKTIMESTTLPTRALEECRLGWMNGWMDTWVSQSHSSILRH